MISIEIDTAALEARVAAFVEDVQRGMVGVVQQTCLDGAEHARAVGAFQDHSGADGLRASIKAFPTVRTAEGAEGSFGTKKPYAAAVEGGQKPHEIRARRRKALAFEAGGELRILRVVQHPGAAPRPFMGPAAIKAEGVLYARAERHVAAAIARADR